MTKDVNIWMKVIEKIGLKFVDEQIGASGNQNILHYKSNHFSCKIWFNRYSDTIILVRIEDININRPTLNEKDIYTKFKKHFREIQLKNILNEIY
jgi:hypothetical protein